MIAPTNKPTLVQWEHLSFVIMDAPNDSNLHLYLKELKKHNVTDLVRACEVTYQCSPVQAAGIRVHELEFPDGEPPDGHILDQWLDLVSDAFKDNKPDAKANKSIAVHCVAGLGRAPVLVAIALIEFGLDPINAVEHIRKYRRGAINLRQLKYLEKYEPRRGAKPKCAIIIPLRDVFSFHAAPAVVDESLALIRINKDNPGFAFDWQLDNLSAFVAAANGLNPSEAPLWLRARPPHITSWSFVDDMVSEFRRQPSPVAGGRVGNLVLAPNTMSQYANVVHTLVVMEVEAFMQTAAQVAFPDATNRAPFLAITYHLLDPSVQNAQRNALSPLRRSGLQLHQLFG